MKKKLISLLLVLMMPVLVLCGCGNAEEKYVQDSMFIVIEHLNINQACFYYVLVNKETRVMYLTQSQGGIVVMVNADGSPMLYEGEL